MAETCTCGLILRHNHPDVDLARVGGGTHFFDGRPCYQGNEPLTISDEIPNEPVDLESLRGKLIDEGLLPNPNQYGGMVEWVPVEDNPLIAIYQQILGDFAKQIGSLRTELFTAQRAQEHQARIAAKRKRVIEHLCTTNYFEDQAQIAIEVANYGMSDEL